MYNFPYVRIVEFEISADELDHLLFLNFNNDLPGKGLRPVFQGALVELIVSLGSCGVDIEGVHFKIMFAIYLHCSILMFVCIILYGGIVRRVAN
jgi:hypothetical protein